jgi:hypothetical protein
VSMARGPKSILVVEDDQNISQTLPPDASVRVVARRAPALIVYRLDVR